MNILLLSDSHGHPDRIREAAERTRPDCILFAGDGLRDLAGAHTAPDVPVYAVRGNCDAQWDPLTAQYPEEQILVLDGVRILLTHGHTLGVKSGAGRAVAHAVSLQADVLVFGHTHEVFECGFRPDAAASALQTARPLLACNPGSIGRYPNSFGTLTLRNGQVLFGSGTL